MNSALLAFIAPGWLWLLPLAALPWLHNGVGVLKPLRFSHLALWAHDAASHTLAHLLRLAASLAIAATVLALAEPYRPEYAVERQGRGAEIVLVLDRSRSMDQSQLEGAGPIGHRARVVRRAPAAG